MFLDIMRCHSHRALKTLKPDKFFQNLLLAKKLTFFWTRFEKMGWRGVKTVTKCHHALKVFSSS